MQDRFYFIPILTEAFDQPDVGASLRAGVSRIRQLGTEPRYRAGFRMFERLLMICLSSTAQEREQLTDDLLMSLINRSVKPAHTEGLPKIQSERVLGELSATIREWFERPAPPTIVVESAGQVLARLPAARDGSVGGVLPGAFRMSLDTGLVLWEGEIEPVDILWDAAPAGQALRAAAAIPGALPPPTRVLKLLRGQVIAELHRGWQAGSLSVHLPNPVG